MVYGRASAWITVPAVTLAGGFALTLSLIGLDAVQKMSPILFLTLKLAGAVYLLFLAFKLWNGSGMKAGIDEGLPQRQKRKIFLNVFTVTALNPKGLIFFVAFIPQFMARGTQGPQLWLTIEVTYLALVIAVFLGYALLAAKAASLFNGQVESAIIAKSASLLLVIAALATAWI